MVKKYLLLLKWLSGISLCLLNENNIFEKLYTKKKIVYAPLNNTYLINNQKAQYTHLYIFFMFSNENPC